MIEITKSNFLNHLIENENLSCVLKEYKKYVETDFDKWLWNRLNNLDHFVNDPNYITNNFDSEKYALNVYFKYVRSTGRSDTDYGEFVRAFNKLAYRYFNDGDDPVNGPYSALQEFLKNPPFCSSRKFEVGFDHFQFTNVDLFNNDYELMDNYSLKFLELIGRVCRGISIFEFGDKEAYYWCNDFISLIDQLIDPIKGLDNCQYPCDEYYKNILEFKRNEIYNFLKENINETRFVYDYDDNYTNYNDSVYICVRSDYNFVIYFEFGRSKYKYQSKKFEIDLNKPNKDIINIIVQLSKINNHIQNKNVDLNIDISLDEFFNQLHLEGSHKNDLIKITKNNEILYEGRIIDLLDLSILNMKIKEFKNNDIELK